MRRVQDYPEPCVQDEGVGVQGVGCTVWGVGLNLREGEEVGCRVNGVGCKV